MVSRDDHSLRFGLRITARLLLLIFVSGLFIAAVTAIATLQNYYLLSERSFHRAWESSASAVALEVTQLAGKGQLHAAALDALRARYGMSRITVTSRQQLVSGSPPNRSDSEIRRFTNAGVVDMAFPTNELIALRQALRSLIVSGIVLVFGAAFVIGFFMYSAARPMQELMGHAREMGAVEAGDDQVWFLINTFRNSIKLLRQQEAELKTLHSLEKSRADDLQRISSALIRSVSSGIIAFDETGSVYDMNDAARAILGVDEATQLAKRSLTNVIGDNEFARAIEEALLTRTPIQREELTLHEERPLTIGLSTVPLISEESKYLGTIALFTDLTPEREMQNRMRDLQSLADLGETSAGIAHEFRNSLSTIMGYIRLAQKTPLTPQAIERLRKAETEARELSSAVSALLTFARPMRLDRHPVDLRELIETTAERIVATTGDIQLSVEGNALPVEGDPNLLARLFENLLRNAIESTRQKRPEGGSIRVQINGEPAEVRVEDEGVGLDPAEAARFFLPFQSDKPNGWGIGLALARKIALLHNAAIRLEGRPGVGATAIVLFSPRPGASLRENSVAATASFD